MSKLARFILLIILLAIAGWWLYPTYKWYVVLTPAERSLISTTEEALDKMSVAEKKIVIDLKKVRKRALSLGLDLQGGVYIVAQVDAADLTNQLMQQNDLDEKKVRSIFPEEYKKATDRILEVLKNRMDSFGVAEPSIRKTFDDRISIELPGMDNPQLIRDGLSKVGKLEFRIMDEEAMASLAKIPTVALGSNGQIVSLQEVPEDFVLPEDSEWFALWENDEFGTPRMMGWYILKSKVEMDGTSIAQARADVDDYGSYKVPFTLTPEGTDIFASVTRNNINKRLAIVLDGKVKSAPRINTEIVGSGEITGSFSADESSLLANVLKAGSLPVKLEMVEERIIGPSLGADSIASGSQAFIWGAIVVVAFMILYYRGAGIISVVGLMFNIFFLVAFLGFMNATLTLAGIAGIALTVGMAVDANVIIYERIREEMRRSRTFKHALENGYANASSTIWDSNLTTLFAAFALSMFGQGNIKGFGTTLMFGIITNIFSALFITRLLFDFFVDTFKLKKFSI